jgi:hypothetical protein
MPLSKRTQRAFAVSQVKIERLIGVCAILLGAELLIVTALPQFGPASKGHADARIRVEEVTAAVQRAFTQTALAITYDTIVREGTTADVDVVVSQRQVITSNEAYGVSDILPPSSEITKLAWPIDLTLSGETKKLPLGANLPARLSWAIQPKADTDEESMILSVSNLLGDMSNELRRRLNQNQKISLDINGQTSSIGPNDDIKLHVRVYKFGVPFWMWQWVTLIGGLISFIIGSALLTGLLSRLWKRMTGAPPAWRDT